MRGGKHTRAPEAGAGVGALATTSGTSDCYMTTRPIELGLVMHVLKHVQTCKKKESDVHKGKHVKPYMHTHEPSLVSQVFPCRDDLMIVSLV